VAGFVDNNTAYKYSTNRQLFQEGETGTFLCGLCPTIQSSQGYILPGVEVAGNLADLFQQLAKKMIEQVGK